MRIKCSRCGRTPASDESDYCQGDVFDGTCGGEFEETPETAWAAWHIESHRDRIMTFLGVFSSEELAKAAIDKNLAENPHRRLYEYTYRGCTIDTPED